MTKAEAIAAIQATGANLTATDITELMGSTDAQVAEIVGLWKDEAQVRNKNVAQEVLTILEQVPDWAAIAIKIGKAIVTIFA